MKVLPRLCEIAKELRTALRTATVQMDKAPDVRVKQFLSVTSKPY
jgi:hypothetical protein